MFHPLTTHLFFHLFYSDEITLSFGQQGHVISMAYSPLVSPLAPKTCDELSTPPTDKISVTSKIDYEAAVPGASLKTVLSSYQPPPGLKFISSKKGTGGSTGMGSGGAAGAADGKPADGFGNKKEQPEMPNSIMGFLQRYWYIIVPMLIMNLLQAEPEQQQQQQQEGGAQGSGSGQAAPGASSGGGGGTKRRGKRG